MGGGTLNPTTGVLLRRGGAAQVHSGKRPWQDRGRDWRAAAASLGTPGATRSWQGQGRSLPRALCLDFRFLASGDSTVLLFVSCPVCCRSPGNLTCTE